LGTTLKITGDGANAQVARNMRLEALATHTAGVPRLPCNLKSFDAANPYAGYGKDELLALASDACWQPIAPTRYEYSSAGYAWLAAAIATKAQKPYDDLLRERVLEPLGMNSTFAAVPSALRSRLAQPHTPEARATPVWDLDALAPALGLKASAEDLLALAARLAKPEKDGIDRVLALAAQPRAASDIPNTAAAMGWLVTDFGPRKLTWLAAGTFGSAAFMAVDRAQGRAVVMLTNSAVRVDDLGMHLLVPELPLAPIRSAPATKSESAKAVPKTPAKPAQK
jgi:CubicO group peptidase (beta-lactamase class C family)